MEPTEQMQQEMQARQKQVEQYKANKQRVSTLLDNYRGEIAKALPKLLTPDRLIRTALTAMSRRPDLMECTSHSLISCILTSAQLGLLPDDILGECYLVPFKNNKRRVKECQLIVGYKGLCTLAMRSGQVKSITAMAVFAANEKDGDKFDYDQGLNEKLEHKPAGMNDANRITHFYAIVRFINGGHVFRVMTRAQVEAVRNESKNYMFAQNKADTVWGKNFEEMGCKTVVRRVMKYVPLSPEMSRAIALDEAAENGTQNTSVEFLDQMPEFTEDVAHEIVNEEDEDKNAAANQAAENATNAAKKATAATEAAIKKAQDKAAKKDQTGQMPT